MIENFFNIDWIKSFHINGIPFIQNQTTTSRVKKNRIMNNLKYGTNDELTNDAKQRWKRKRRRRCREKRPRCVVNRDLIWPQPVSLAVTSLLIPARVGKVWRGRLEQTGKVSAERRKDKWYRGSPGHNKAASVSVCVHLRWNCFGLIPFVAN